MRNVGYEWSVREWTRQSIKDVMKAIWEGQPMPRISDFILKSVQLGGPSVTIYYCGEPTYGPNNIVIQCDTANYSDAVCGVNNIDLESTWYPVAILPLFQVKVGDTVIKAQDLQFETSDIKVVQDTIFIDNIVNNYPSDITLPSMIAMPVIIIYFGPSQYYINSNNQYDPFGTFFATPFPKLNLRHDFKIEFLYPSLYTPQCKACTFRFEEEFMKYYSSHYSRYEIKPVKQTMKWDFSEVVTRNLSGRQTMYYYAPHVSNMYADILFDDPDPIFNRTIKPRLIKMTNAYDGGNTAWQFDGGNVLSELLYGSNPLSPVKSYEIDAYNGVDGFYLRYNASSLNNCHGLVRNSILSQPDRWYYDTYQTYTGMPRVISPTGTYYDPSCKWVADHTYNPA